MLVRLGALGLLHRGADLLVPLTTLSLTTRDALLVGLLLASHLVAIVSASLGAPEGVAPEVLTVLLLTLGEVFGLADLGLLEVLELVGDPVHRTVLLVGVTAHTDRGLDELVLLGVVELAEPQRVLHLGTTLAADVLRGLDLVALSATVGLALDGLLADTVLVAVLVGQANREVAEAEPRPGDLTRLRAVRAVQVVEGRLDGHAVLTEHLDHVVVERPLEVVHDELLRAVAGELDATGVGLGVGVGETVLANLLALGLTLDLAVPADLGPLLDEASHLERRAHLRVLDGLTTLVDTRAVDALGALGAERVVEDVLGGGQVPQLVLERLVAPVLGNALRLEQEDHVHLAHAVGTRRLDVLHLLAPQLLDELPDEARARVGSDGVVSHGHELLLQRETFNPATNSRKEEKQCGYTIQCILL